jgi:hypothetical protein
MAFNLFDFSSVLNPLGNVVPTSPQPTQVGGATGGGNLPPTITAKPLPQTPIVKKPIVSEPTFMEKAVNMIAPKASAWNYDEDKIKEFSDELKKRWLSSDKIRKAIITESELGSFDTQEQPTQEPSTSIDYPTDLEPAPSSEPAISTSPSFFDKIGQAAEKRGTTYLDLASTDSNFITKWLWAVWEGVGFIGDVIGEWLSSAFSSTVWEASKNPLSVVYWWAKGWKAVAKEAWNALPELTKEWIGLAIETGGDVAKAVGEWWKQVEEVAPETARNLKSVAQIVTSLPWGKPAKTAILSTVWATNDIIDLAKQIPEIKPNIIKKAQDYYSKSELKEFNKPASLPDAQYKSASEIWRNSKSKWVDLWEVAINDGIQFYTLDDGGKFNSIDAAKSVREDAIKASNDMVIEGLREADKFTEPTSANKLRGELLKQLENDKTLTLAQKEARIKYIDREFDGIIKDYGEELSLESMQKGKVKFDRNSKYDNEWLPSDSNIYKANKAIADKLRASIEIGAWDNLPVLAVNKELWKHFALADYLDELHWKKVPQSKLSKFVKIGAKAVWWTTWATIWGWPIWAFAWYQTMAVLFDTLQNIPSPMRVKMLNSIKRENPEAYRKMQEFILQQKFGAKKTFPLLPAGTKESIRNVRGEVIDNTLQESTASKVAKSKEELSGKITRERPYSEIVKEQMNGKTIQTKKIPTTIKKPSIKKPYIKPQEPKGPTINVKKYATGEAWEYVKPPVPKGPSLYGKGKPPIKKPKAK